MKKSISSLLKRSAAAVVLLSVMAFRPDTHKITVYLIGDSTMSVKEATAWPETGWGMPFAHFFDSSVVVDNRAKNGRSTRSFLAENRWQPVVDQLSTGDYVFIQFGHNDESKDKGDRYATPEEYTTILTRFVKETRSKGATPVLITPVSRRKFDKTGKALETHAQYAPLVREVAAANKVLLIDLDAESLRLYQQIGDTASKMLFLQLKPGEHPNYPEGKTDNTHFNELGARLIAQLVLKDVAALDLPLAQHIIKPKPAKK